MNEHKDKTKPYWVAKSEDNSVLHYGKITDNSLVNTLLPITTFEDKKDFILFIESNGVQYEQSII